jgi:hypothetical protein
MAFGGTAQIIAGIMEFKTGNVFGATAFTSYGAFWWWFALLILLGTTMCSISRSAGTAIGVCLLLWGVFTFGLWMSTFRLSRLLFCHLPDLVDRLLPAGRGRVSGQSHPAHCWAAGSACSAGAGHVWQLCPGRQRHLRPGGRSGREPLASSDRASKYFAIRLILSGSALACLRQERPARWHIIIL